MTYLIKIYTNIAPTGHNISFTERQNPPYSFLLGFISPWNIVITTQCSICGSSFVFIKPQKYDNSHQNNDSSWNIPHLLMKTRQRIIFVSLVEFPQSFFDPLDLLNQLIRINGRGDIFFKFWLCMFHLPWLKHLHEHTTPFRFNHLSRNYTLTYISLLLQQFQACA